ncbi:hypothetical protein FB566_1388 [Stackebrandtia endophytica]|uniref:Lipoprotein n=1 Tax=Stackebrandtia endophytica TaxID=1496996 RepID=A0A543ATH5_9ACTN|nr:hypothetical protein [Stackebrandtia endophytica]TQL75873.1 hypothetical protein FB566_1388 [Stackebrandtia endophytica]
MSGLSRLTAVGAVFGVVATLAAGCNGLGGGPSDDGDSVARTDPYVIVSLWKGCDVLDDLNPIQQFLGVESVNEYGLMDSDPSLAERPSCQGQFIMPAFLLNEGTESEKQWAGNASLSVSITPKKTDDEASTDYQSMIDQLHGSGSEMQDAQEGELAGDWDESYLLAGDGGTNYNIYAFARHENWWIRAIINVSPDPGRDEYERRPEAYPGSSADEMAAYQFTMPELVDWVTNQYFPDTEAALVTRIADDACAKDPAVC